MLKCKALVLVIFAWAAVLVARAFIAVAFLLLAIPVAGYLIFYGTWRTGDVCEKFVETLKRYRI